ncbi:hypothetical protein WMF30_02100 [Sorangium sp. So ce134]
MRWARWQGAAASALPAAAGSASPSGQARLRRAASASPRAALLALAVAVSCSVMVDLDPLADGVSCPEGEKPCLVEIEGEPRRACVSIADPLYGCTAEGCAPCDLKNTVSRCDMTGPVGRCFMSSCLNRHENCDGDIYNGCETDTENDSLHCSKCNAPCTCGRAAAACEEGVCQKCER